MSINHQEISDAVDVFLLETAVKKPWLVKQAQFSPVISTIISKVKEYFMAHVDQNDITGSVINMLAPGVIALLFKSFNFKWTGILIGLLINVLHIDVAGIIRSFASGVKGLVTGGKASIEGVDAIGQSLIQQHASNSITASYTKTDARMLKLALIQYESGLTKTASIGSELATATFVKFLGWIFKAILMASGLMAAGDIANKLVGRPSALSGTIQSGKPVSTPMPTHISSQTKFKVNPNYHDVEYNTDKYDVWYERAVNNTSSIENMLLTFAKQVYNGLDGLESVIKQSTAFQVIVKHILDWNIQTPNDSMVFIPDVFHSKKQIVDYFIDDVAKAK